MGARYMCNCLWKNKHHCPSTGNAPNATAEEEWARLLRRGGGHLSGGSELRSFRMRGAPRGEREDNVYERHFHVYGFTAMIRVSPGPRVASFQRLPVALMPCRLGAATLLREQQ